MQSSLAQAGLVRACGAHGMWTRESVAAVSCDDSMGAKPAHGGTQEGKPSHGPSASLNGRGKKEGREKLSTLVTPAVRSSGHNVVADV